MSARITFLGAAGTVTGSKYLVETEGQQILVDCGIFQGAREWRDRNWDPLPLDASRINSVLITHAHLDHIGMLPRYVKEGLNCPIYCSAATADLMKLLLLDSARLQEEEAEYRNQNQKSRHHPALPLYTVADAERTLTYIRRVECEAKISISPTISATWNRMGHIIGACSITLTSGTAASGMRTINFSGDVGRYTVPILHDPAPMNLGDLLLIESTYGDRAHPENDDGAALAAVVNRTISRRGIVLIPSFAVGRTQNLLYYLRELKEKRIIPDIPVIVDSPMARDATSIYRAHAADYDEAALGIIHDGRHPFQAGLMRFTASRAESIKLNRIDEPMIIISANGMVSGGRILHHLKHRVSDPRNTVLFVGFQPPGGRGDWLLRGATSIRLLGDEMPVRAEISEISGLSAHADRDELIRWCTQCTGTPAKVAVVHGEPEIARSFATTLKAQLKWNTAAPNYLEQWEI